MACGSAQNEEHCATLGLFMEDDMGEVYGVTVKHATVHSDISIYIRCCKDDIAKSDLLLGEPMNIANSASKDIGLIKINSKLKGQTSNLNGCYRVSMHDRGIANLHDRTVKKYLPSSSEYEMNKEKHRDIGRAVPESEHLKYLGATKDHFLVELTRDGKFSAPGESGTIISLHQKTGSEQEILLGMILGEFSEDKNYTVCLYLSKGVEDMNKSLGNRLRICNSDSCSFPQVRRSHHSKDIHCGIRIFLTFNNTFVKTPEKINPLSFDVADRCRALLCKKFVEVNMSKFTMVMRAKSNLSAEINERTYLGFRTFDSAEMVAVKSGLLACDSLYQENLKTGEEDFKLALYSAAKCDESTQMRIVYELATYVTWYLLAKNTRDSLKVMQDMLDEAIEDFNEARNKRGFPLHSLGYLYYDYSRLYMAKYDDMRSLKVRMLDKERKLREKAVKKAEQGYELLKGLYLQEKTKEHHTRMVLSLCQVVYCLLGCGSEFRVVGNEVTGSDVEKAELLLKSLECSIPDLEEVPLVQRANYFIAKCDLFYRKGNVFVAFTYARDCLKLLQGNKYKSVEFRASNRYQYLQALLFKIY